MGRAQPVDLPSKQFAKKSDALDFFKEMLNRYSDGERINEADSILLAQLLRRHPDDKIGAGTDYFFRAPNPEQPTSCFHVMRSGGNPTDFSYFRCVSGKKPGVQDYLYRACRFAVSHYLTKKKNDLFTNGPVRDPTTGQMLTKENSEYRHTSPPFKDLVARFVSLTNLNVDFSLFPEDRDMQYNVTFIDPALERQFVAFHMQEANLHLVAKKRP